MPPPFCSEGRCEKCGEHDSEEAQHAAGERSGSDHVSGQYLGANSEDQWSQQQAADPCRGKVLGKRSGAKSQTMVIFVASEANGLFWSVVNSYPSE